MSGAFRGGSFECRLIADGRGFLPPELVFENAPAESRAAALSGRLDRAGRLAIAYGCLLARSADEVVLIDTGIGGYEHPFGGRGGELDSALEAAGVSRDDVGFVVLTHAHLDHIGGLCSEGRPRFPAARHVMSRIEWDWLSEDDDPIDREQLLPLEEKGILELVEGTVDLVADIRLIPAPGHTPGQLAVEVGRSGGALYLADVVVDELHVEHPEWVMSFDDDPDVAVETRNALLERAADEERIVAAAHLGNPGRIERVQGGLRFMPLRSEP
jgi:glyoxylase-like metal-dependent hydrolase (beta-lactamase superfamily II)